MHQEQADAVACRQHPFGTERLFHRIDVDDAFRIADHVDGDTEFEGVVR